MTIQLSCPDCGNLLLESVEKMHVHYECRLTRKENGELDVEYTGERRDFDETAEQTGDYWCRVCDKEFPEDELEETPIEDSDDTLEEDILL